MNHSGPAQDLALLTVNKLKAGVIILSEPYLLQGRMLSAPGWQRIYPSNSAILLEDGMSYSRINDNSSNTLAVELGRVLVVGTCLSLKSDPSDQFLVLHNLLLHGSCTLLAADFNCWYPGFSSRPIWNRDLTFIQLTLDHRLEIANNNSPT